MNRRGRGGHLAAVIVLVVSVLSGAVVTGASAQAEDPALDWSNYEKVTLTKDTGEPIDLAVMDDGRVLHTARDGVVRLTDPSVGTTEEVATFDVYNNSEDGLQGIALDPDFASNQWVYVYYAPREMSGTAENGAAYPATTPTGSAPNQVPDGEDASYWDQWQGYNQLARVKWDASSNSLDLSTEQVIITVEANRGQCCHVAGDIDFDDEGNVYLSTGDNTPASTPGANGFAPNNNAPGFNPGFDSRRGAGNTNDLRGAILRITPQDDGSYTIPDGNLFDEADDTDDQTRPELFAMGLRNPFRMEVDPETNSLSWGDYGPDSGTANPDRGPMGLVEWQTTSLDTPMNGGWPYCTGDNFNYNEWDYATATPGDFFDCGAGAENNSTWNDGLSVLPAAVPASLYYGDDEDDQPWPELTSFGGGGQGPMGGPVYHYDESNPDSAMPEYWDNKAFFAEFSQDYLAAFTVDWPGGPVTEIEQFLPNAALEENFQPITDNPIDIEFGPDGSLYVLDYGDGFFRQNPDAGLYRIDYAEGNKSPTASISADPISASEAPLTVQFDASGSSDPDGDDLTYEWDFDGDGTFDATGVTGEYTYTETGAYSARLRVTDPGGRIGIISTGITVGNVAPTVTVETPPAGAFFDWGDAVPFTVTSSDPEDGDETVCGNVAWTFGLGHNSHAHPLSQGTGCNFSIPTPADATEHGETENVYGVVVVRYTDQGSGDIAPATAEVAFILNPKEQEAEWADEMSGVEVVEDANASGFDKIDSFDPGDYLAWDPVNFVNVDSVSVAASGQGELQLRWNAPDAEPFGTIAVDSAELAETEAVDLTGAPEGTGVLYVTSSGGVVLDTVHFGGAGVADVTPPEVSLTTDPAEPNGPDGSFIGQVGFSVDATDNGGIASRQYSKDGGETWNNILVFGGNTFCTDGGFGPCVIDEVGTTTLQYRATDTAGNVSEVGETELTVVEPDAEAPEVSITLDPTEPNGPDGDYVGSVGFSIQATDNYGVDTVEYSKDDGETWLVQGSFGSFTYCTEGGFGPCQVSEVGTTNLLYRATDASGNVSEVGEVEITIAPDTYAPTVDATLLGTFTGEFVASDGYDTAGTAELVVTPNSTTASADLSGLAPNQMHQGHLHNGTCDTMPMGGHYQDDPDGPSAPPNELWLVDDASDPDAGFMSDGDGNATVSGSADWSARATAQSVVVHGGELGLPRGCATVDTASSSVEIAFEATDLGDLDRIEYRVATDGEWGDWVESQGSGTVTEPGDHVVEYRAIDTAGNVSEVGTVAFTIDIDPDADRILIFSKTAGFRHGSISVGRQAIRELAAEDGVAVDVTEDATFFTEENLSRYDAVVWLSTTGDVLDEGQQAAFESYIQDGGGFAGVHAASDTEYDWEWYGDLVGAYFEGHPPGTPEATLIREDADHPSTAHLPEEWTRNDEWYSFQENPREDVNVLLSIDESTYAVGDLAMDDHPMSWCHDYDGGRSWYTALGHTNASYTTDELFRTHLWNGIATAAGYVETDCFEGGSGGVDDGDQQITVTVPDDGGTGGSGDFVWSIAGNGSVDLGEMADQGRYLQATGPMDPIIVTDTRTDGPRWSISGQVSDFTPGDLAGNHLGWLPRVLEQGAGAEAGARVASGIDGGPGLSVPSTLASADDGHEAGTARVGAQFDLRFPAGTDAGDYTATMTITALS